MRLFEELAQNMRYGFRMLAKSPGFTAAAVLILALGIGANTAIFSIADALLFRLLPFPHPERLVLLESQHAGWFGGVGPEDFRDWQTMNTVFEAMAYTSFSQLNLTGQSFPGFGEPERITGKEVSAGFFSTLDVQPSLGRWFLPEEQKRGRNQVIVLSHGLWVRRFGAKPDILGQSLTLNDRSFVIIGVMPAGFRFTEDQLSEFWVPLQHSAVGRGIHQYSAYARLRPGVTVRAAQAQMSAIAQQLEQTYPESNSGWGVKVTALHDLMMEEFGPVLLLFFAATAVVLLIACANVANLLLARVHTRTREIAIRRALGASPGSIVRMQLTESLLLTLFAAVMGLLFAVWGIDVAIAAAPVRLELRSLLHINPQVLAFTLLTSILTCLLTGLTPAFHASRANLSENLKQAGGGVRTGATHSYAMNALVVSEVAMAAVLLVAAGLLSKSFLRLLQVNLGLRTENVLIARMQLYRFRYIDPNQSVEFFRNLVEAVRNLPGVISAGAIDSIPMGGAYSGGPIEIEGRPNPRDWTEVGVQYHIATPDYFHTLDIPLRRGRHFTDQDRLDSEPVVIVNETLVRQFFAGEDAIRKRIRLDSSSPWLTIIGIVGDVRHGGPESPVRSETYFPHAQIPSNYMFLAVRTAVPPGTLFTAVRSEIHKLDPNLPVMQMRTMEQALSETISLHRHLMILAGFFAALSLILAALGLGGLLWYSVSQRTHEIGVRMALGARRSDVLRSIMGRGLGLSLAGLAIGLTASFGLRRLLSRLLFGVRGTDPTIYLVLSLILIAVTLLACYLPARRATKVDPLVTLRAE